MASVVWGGTRNPVAVCRPISHTCAPALQTIMSHPDIILLVTPLPDDVVYFILASLQAQVQSSFAEKQVILQSFHNLHPIRILRSVLFRQPSRNTQLIRKRGFELIAQDILCGL